jgi:hypothetical protein
VDPALDSLAEEIAGIVASAEKKKESRTDVFQRIWDAASRLQAFQKPQLRLPTAIKPAPYLSEPWYC